MRAAAPENYDYVIVGGGMAGCILAARLTASGKHRVLMLESGQEGTSTWISIPAGFSKLLTNPTYNWRFQTEPEESTLGRVIGIPRGKGIGGSAIINGMVYVRGQPEDYDNWERAGAHGWAFRDVEPYFKKLEDYPQGDARRGHGGPVEIRDAPEHFPIVDAFLDAAAEAGHPRNVDYNAGRQDGFAYFQLTQRKGRRWSVVDAYLNPARQRQNLRIETNAHVTHLRLKDRKCIGVAYTQHGQEISVDANKEVLMAAGAIQTPQVLELSGIGNPTVLGGLGIPVIHALPNVGENYIDHFGPRMNWRVKNTLTLNETTRGWRLALEIAKYFICRKGALGLGAVIAGGFVKSRADIATPDIQYLSMHASYASAAERKLDKWPGMTVAVTQMRPESRGSIHIRSPDPLRAPAIRPNFLSSELDRRCLTEGVKIMRNIFAQPAMQKYVDREMTPGPSVTSDADLLDYIRSNGQTFFHPVGTCRMGIDNAAVVDPHLKVKGMTGLRVVDAAVIPVMVSGNTQAAVMMVAEKAADLVLADAGA